MEGEQRDWVTEVMRARSVGRSGHWEDLDLNHRSVLTRDVPRLLSEARSHMIVEEPLVYFKKNPSPPLLQLSMPFLESPTLKGNASSCF